jgi:putative endonuclease
MPAWVYMMASKRNGTLYVGTTNNLARRIHQHRSGHSNFTERYDVSQLVWFEEHPTMPHAILREHTIKGWPRKWKLNTIEAMNPEWDDLYHLMNM